MQRDSDWFWLTDIQGKCMWFTQVAQIEATAKKSHPGQVGQACPLWHS